MLGNNYYLILSPPGCGKTTVSKYISSRFDYKLIDWEETQTKLKEKLGGENGPLEELPFIEIINYFNRTDNSIKNHFYSTLRRSLRRINKHVGDKNSNLLPYIFFRYCLNT